MSDHNDQSATDSAAAAAGDSGWAPAKHFCEHVAHHVRPFPPNASFTFDKCSECSNANENWLCLSCHTVFCGRHSNGHMVAHSTTSGHVVAAGFGDLSFWCYSCESYLHHLSMRGIWQAYYALHIMKFKEAPKVTPDFTSNDHHHNGANTPATSAAPATAATATSTAAGEMKAAATPSFANDIAINGLTTGEQRHPLVDRILGCLYGNALGDAVGLATEFMDKKGVIALYGSTPIPFPHFERNHHNKRWKLGDWTDDTDQLILIMDTILEHKKVDERVFAAKLRYWISHGFPELGDSGGMGLGMTVANVCHHPNFLTSPHNASEEVWIRSGRSLAANGAIMRTSILGCWQYNDDTKVIANTDNIARVTHSDPRCIASSVATTLLIARILSGRACSTLAECDALIDEVATITRPMVTPQHLADYNAHIAARKLEDLKLDDPKTIGYTLKCFGCGLYGMRSMVDFKTTLRAIAIEAGDADTNGAVCGAVLGAKIGYGALPKDWISAMPNKKWLDAKVVGFLKLMFPTGIPSL